MSSQEDDNPGQQPVLLAEEVPGLWRSAGAHPGREGSGGHLGDGPVAMQAQQDIYERQQPVREEGDVPGVRQDHEVREGREGERPHRAGHSQEAAG